MSKDEKIEVYIDRYYKNIIFMDTFLDLNGYRDKYEKLENGDFIVSFDTCQDLIDFGYLVCKEEYK